MQNVVKLIIWLWRKNHEIHPSIAGKNCKFCRSVMKKKLHDFYQLVTENMEKFVNGSWRKIEKLFSQTHEKIANFVNLSQKETKKFVNQSQKMQNLLILCGNKPIKFIYRLQENIAIFVNWSWDFIVVSKSKILQKMVTFFGQETAPWYSFQ